MASAASVSSSASAELPGIDARVGRPVNDAPGGEFVRPRTEQPLDDHPVPADVPAGSQHSSIPAPGLVHRAFLFVARALQARQANETRKVLDHRQHRVDRQLAWLVIECVGPLTSLCQVKLAGRFFAIKSRTASPAFDQVKVVKSTFASAGGNRNNSRLASA